MRVTLAQTALLEMARLASRAADPVSLAVADSHVLLVAQKLSGELGAVAHGGLLGVRVRRAAGIERDGRALVSADRLRALVAQLGAGSVTLDVGANHHVTMLRGKRRLTLPGADPDGYPTPSSRPTEWHTLPVGALALGLRETHYASAFDPKRRHLRPHLAGVRVEAGVQDGRLECFANDGARAAYRSEPYRGASFAVTLPAGLVEAVRKGLFGKVPKDALDGTEPHEAALESIDIAVTERSVWLRRGGDDTLTVAAPKLADEYPAWRGIMASAEQCPHVAAIDRAAWLGAVSALASIERDEFARVRTTLLWSDAALTMQAETAMGGSGSDEVLLSGLVLGEGPAGCVVNAAYVRDALKSWACDRVRVRFGGPRTLVFIEPETVGVRSFAVVMPISDD